MNVPVACGGVVVHPGDIVSASGEGVAVVPQRAAHAVAAELADRKADRPVDIGRFLADIVSDFDADRQL